MTQTKTEPTTPAKRLTTVVLAMSPAYAERLKAVLDVGGHDAVLVQELTAEIQTQLDRPTNRPKGTESNGTSV